MTMEKRSFRESNFSKKNNFSQNENVLVVWNSTHLFCEWMKFFEKVFTMRDGRSNENLFINIMEIRNRNRGVEKRCSLEKKVQDIKNRRRIRVGMISLFAVEINEKFILLKILIWTKFPDEIDRRAKVIMFLKKK
jgi:hypothetical protein